MEQFFRGLSKGVLATLAIIAGTIFFILNDPPHSVCDTQKEEMKKLQNEFLYESVPNPITGESANQFTYLVDYCKNTNTPGGCLELFLKLKSLSRDLDNVISDCRIPVGEMATIKKTIWGGISLLTKLAWGSQPPGSYLAKNNWLTIANIDLYCDLKRQAVTYYGRENWQNFREKMFKDLPGAPELQRGQAWELMLLSTNCSSFR